MPSDAEKERDAWRGVIATICCDGGHYHQAHGTAATKEHCIRRVVADRTRADAAEHERDALKARVKKLEAEFAKARELARGAPMAAELDTPHVPSIVRRLVAFAWELVNDPAAAQAEEGD